MSRSLLAFPWYGGKASHLKWLLPIIDNVSHKTYVESFGGSAAVLLNKKQSPVEVYNDCYGDVVNFFRTLRSRRDELLPLLELTLYSREEFAESCKDKEVDDLERARLFFVKARQVTMGLATKASPGRWGYIIKDSRRGMSMAVSRWLSSIEGLQDVCERLRAVQIENLDALDVIKRYDTAETLHYVDPPYLMNVRSGGVAYEYEFDELKHLELLSTLKSLNGKVVLSGYENQVYAEELSGWQEYKAEATYTASTRGCGRPSLRQQVVWANFQIER